jgi:transcriptional regulator with XRE-family HTH domain
MSSDTIKKLMTLARKGVTQAEAARQLGISRARVNQIAQEMRISFARRKTQRVVLICPDCGFKRTIPEWRLDRYKSAYCVKHAAVHRER